MKSLTVLASNVEAAVEAIAKRARVVVAIWDKTVTAKKKEYQTFIEKQGGDRPALLAKKTSLESQRPSLTGAVATLRQRIERLPSLRDERRKLLVERDAEIGKRHALRREKYLSLTSASNGRLQLELTKDGERSQYVAALSALKSGSRLQESTIEQICEAIHPRDLLAIIANGDVDALIKASKISTSSAKTLLGHLAASADAKGLLALEHGELLRDIPMIRFRKDDGKYYDLAQLSVGQKCTALLIIALADGERPIIIDQPEDALDITSVYEDVALQLRSRKQSRQFIVTTHNPTVAVAADSDQFHVLKASASLARLATEGAIDRPVVRDAVIQHLEGGPESFALKTKKYGLPVS
jgi:predicted ATP-dependent endonuclease of OLD family